MRIQVSRILLELSTSPLIEFRSAYGVGRARWAENTPQLFQDYDVEFELAEMLIWGQTIILHTEERMAVAYQDNALLLSGRLEINEDGIGYLRVGGSLILLEIQAGTACSHAPCFVSVLSKQAMLYDTGI